MSTAKAAAALLFNFASGPATILGNKIVFAQAEFHFPVALTFIHYCATWLTVRGLARLGIYKPHVGSGKGSETRAINALIIAWSFYNIASNTSLSKNSVAMYQMVKLLMTPLAVAWDVACYGKWPTCIQLGLLALAVFGVSLYTASAAEFNVAGLAVGLVSVCLAIVQKGLTTHIQQHTETTYSPLQLLDVSMPGMAAVTLASAFVIDDFPELLNYNFSGVRCTALVASGVTGTLANVSSTWVLGLTSPIAHILLGQLKTILVLIGGVLFFDSHPKPREVLGAALALTAITGYTWSKLPPRNEASQVAATNPSRSKVQQRDPWEDGEDVEMGTREWRRGGGRLSA